MEFNQDYKLRNTMLNIDESTECGGTWRFEGCTAETLETLIQLGFADPEEYQNSSPTIADFLVFLKAHPSFTAHGYVVSADREDYRTSVEGVEGHSDDDMEREDFIETFRHADEFQFGRGYQYAWYD